MDGYRATAAAWMLVLLWMGALAAWTRLAWARSGTSAALAMACLMLASPWFRDLPTWRSWLTTGGELCFLGLALLLMERGRWSLALISGLVAILFKEPAALVLAPLAWRCGRRAQASLYLLALVPGALAFSEKSGSLQIVGNLVFYLETAGPLLLVPAILALLTGRREPWLLLASALALGPALVHDIRNPVYLLESSLVLFLLASSTLARPGRAVVLLLPLAILPGLLSLPQSLENQRWQQEQWRLALHIAEVLESEPAGRLHCALHAHEGGRYAAFLLERELGWEVVDSPLGRDMAHGLSVEAGVAR